MSEGGRTVAPPDRVGPPASADRRQAVVGGLWMAAGSVVPMASTLLLSVVIARTLGPVELGQQSYVALVASLLATLLLGSLTSAGLQLLAAARGRGGAREVRRLERVVRVGLTGAGTLSALVLLALGLVREELRVVWLVAAVTAQVDGAVAAAQTRLVAREGWGRVGARRLVAQIAGPLLGVAALGAGLGVPGVFAAQALAALGLLLALGRLRTDEPVPAPGSAAEAADAAPPVPARAVVALTASFFASIVLVGLMERRIEVLFLERASTESQVAMYSVAFNLVAVASFACGSITAAAMPSIAALGAAGETGKIHDALARAARLVVTLSLLLAAAVAAVGPATVVALYGPRFTEAAALVPWLCLSLLLAPLAGLARVYWSGLGLLRPVLASGAVGLAADVATALVLVPRWEAAGAVAANVVGVSCGSLVLLAHTRRRLGRPLVGARPVLGALAVAAPSAGAAVAAAGALPGVPGVLLAGAVFCAVALAVTRVVPPVERGDVAWLTGALPSRVGPAVRWLGEPHVTAFLLRRG